VGHTELLLLDDVGGPVGRDAVRDDFLEPLGNADGEHDPGALSGFG